MKLEHVQKTTLNPLRENTNREIVDKINSMVESIREIQNIILMADDNDENWTVQDPRENDDNPKYCVCQDGNMFYVQTDPEDETYLASFSSEKSAEKYVKFLEDES